GARAAGGTPVPGPRPGARRGPRTGRREPGAGATAGTPGRVAPEPAGVGLAAAAAGAGGAHHPPRGRPGRQVGDVRALFEPGPGGGGVHGPRPGAGAAVVQGAKRLISGPARKSEQKWRYRTCTLPSAGIALFGKTTDFFKNGANDGRPSQNRKPPLVDLAAR